MTYPKHFKKLIALLKHLPGVGSRTAERHAFQLMKWTPQQRRDFAHTISGIDELLFHCEECGCLREKEECGFCGGNRYALKSLCVVATARDACIVEETGFFSGSYHVLGGLLSPLEGIDDSSLRIGSLMSRIQKYGIEEIILALDATLEGDATSFFLKEKLTSTGVKISRLAFGLPMGSAFDFIDGNTLARAFMGRCLF